jgi:hypothetical protein
MTVVARVSRSGRDREVVGRFPASENRKNGHAPLRQARPKLRTTPHDRASPILTIPSTTPPRLIQVSAISDAHRPIIAAAQAMLSSRSIDHAICPGVGDGTRTRRATARPKASISS